MAKKCTKNDNTRAQLLNLLFSDVPIAVAINVDQRSLFPNNLICTVSLMKTADKVLSAVTAAETKKSEPRKDIDHMDTSLSVLSQ